MVVHRRFHVLVLHWWFLNSGLCHGGYPLMVRTLNEEFWRQQRVPTVLKLCTLLINE